MDFLRISVNFKATERLNTILEWFRSPLQLLTNSQPPNFDVKGVKIDKVQKTALFFMIYKEYIYEDDLRFE